MVDPNLQMFRSDTPTVEVGTLLNPIDFGFCLAGAITDLPYDIILWNDKEESLGSNDAYNIYIQLLRLETSEIWISSGAGNQTFTTTYFPIVIDSQEVIVDGEAWSRVDSLMGYDQKSVYTINYTTGLITFGDNVNGKIPPTSVEIVITYTPDTNVFGKTLYSDQWLSLQSSGVVENVIDVDIELSTKIDDSTIEILHFPSLYDVVGVWDNISKTGINYYTGGSFDISSGRILLGTPLTSSDPYVEYSYKIKDDNEGAYTSLGNSVSHGALYRIPRNNAKRIKLRIETPSTTNTEGGAYIRVVLRVLYQS